MPAFGVEVDHELGQELAIERLKFFIQRIGDKYQDQLKDVQQSWNENVMDFSFRSMGQTISGAMFVNADQVKVDGQLPFIAMAFRGTIENSIRTELEKALRSKKA
ncbi:MAG: polyhydroxyalkanoic acid system family protein [bacterium]|nr:polyhydroxyalkanoic acid system family protein [bacterium]